MSLPPITPEQRVRHFLSTVEDYERLEANLPLGGSIGYVTPPTDEFVRWKMISHAMLQRKYFAPTDGLSLTKVMRAFRALVSDHWRGDSDWDLWEKNIALLDPAMDYPLNGRIYNESELLQLALYGRYLHGDFHKWAGEPNQSAQDIAASIVTTGRAGRIRLMRDLILLAAKEGALDLGS